MKLVLLPGLDGTGKLFQPLTSSPPEGWTTHNISYPEKISMSYGELFGFVRERLPKREPYLLLGESFSGPIAIKMASENQQGMVGLILCNTFARKPWWPIFGYLPWSILFRRPIPRIIMKRMGADNENPTLQFALKDALSPVAPKVLAKRLKETLMIDVSKELKHINVPILYLRGTKDSTVREWSLDYIKAIRPDVMVHDFPVAHLLLQLVPKQAWEAIVLFRARSSM